MHHRSYVTRRFQLWFWGLPFLFSPWKEAARPKTPLAAGSKAERWGGGCLRVPCPGLRVFAPGSCREATVCLRLEPVWLHCSEMINLKALEFAHETVHLWSNVFLPQPLARSSRYLPAKRDFTCQTHLQGRDYAWRRCKAALVLITLRSKRKSQWK